MLPLGRYFEYFSNVLVKNDDDDADTDEFTFGRHFTYADAATFGAINLAANKFKLMPFIKESFPKIAAYHELVVVKRTRIQM